MSSSASTSTTEAHRKPAVTVHSQNLPDVYVTLKPGELNRMRTDWTEGSREVEFDLENGSALRFDNLSFSQPVSLGQ